MFVDKLNALARRCPTWPVYVLGAVPAVALFYLAFTGGLGIDPVRGIEHELGVLGIQFLILSLIISPLRRFFYLNLIKFRRALGLLTFFYVSLHLGVWLLLDMQLLWSEIWRDIYKRPYITIGMISFVILVPLSVTSCNAAIKYLGAPRWNKLHKLCYLAAVLAALHYIMVQKVWELEPLIYATIVIALIATRFTAAKPAARRARAKEGFPAE